MISEIYTSSTFGVEAYIIRVETHLESGFHKFSVVGLPDNTVKESRDRVRAAIKNSDLYFPDLKRISINLSPADIKKEGTGFDLPIAIGLLTETSQITLGKIKDYIFIGELSLDGKLRHIAGVLPIAIEARRKKFKGIILPAENAKEASVVENIDLSLIHI